MNKTKMYRQASLDLQPRGKSIPMQRRVQLDHIPIPEFLMILRKWIEECTEVISENQTFLEYLSDGTVLCRLIQTIQPGLIKRMNRIRSPFAWRENILFFLEACRKLGLKESQLFAPEDLYEDSSTRRSYHQSKSYSQEKRLRKVCELLYFLGLKAADLPDYSGPTLPPLPSISVLDNSKQVLGNCRGKEFLSTQNLPSTVSHSRTTNYRPGSAVRKVQSVANLITETSNTGQQSFAEVVLFFNNHKQDSGNSRTTGSVDKLSSTELQRTETSQVSSDSTAHSSSVFYKATSLQHLNTHRSPSIGEETPPISSTPSDHREFDFSRSPSEASTVIYRDSAVSPFSEARERNSSSHSSLNSPQEDTSSSFNSVSPSLYSQPSTEEAIFINNHFSPLHLSNKPVDSHIDHTGIITTNHISSQDTFTGTYSSPEREATYHYSLTQKSEEQSPAHCLSHNPDSQRLKPVNCEMSFDGPPIDIEGDLLSGLLEQSHHPTVMSGGPYTTQASDPVSIPERKPWDSLHNVPHHSINVLTTGPDSPSSYQESHTQHTEALTDCDVDVTLLPGEERLGLNLVEDSESDVLLRVKAIGPDTAAARSNLRCGDELLAVNHVPLQRTPLNVALGILQEAMSAGRFVLRVRRAENRTPNTSHYKSLRPPDLLDMSRVTSDALPHSMSATMVQLNTEPSESSTPDILESAITEVLSSPDDDLDKRPGTQEEAHTMNQPDCEPTDPKPSSQHSKNTRPVSAPTKSHASTVLSSNKSRTLPNKSSISRLAREKQAMEREKRISNIQTNAQILLKYSRIRKSSQSGSLPRDYQSLSQLGKLFELGDDSSSRPSPTARSSSPELTHSNSSTSANVDESSSASTPLNLRHISMDETRVASLIQMDNIWRQVESGEDSPNLAAERKSNSLEPSTSNINEPGTTDVVDGNQVSDNGCVQDESCDSHSNAESYSGDDVVKSTDITVSIAEPQASSTPLVSSSPAVSSPSLPTPVHPEARERTASFSNKDIDSLLITLKSLGTPEDNVDDLKVLEDMLKSNTFKKARKVHDQMHQLLSGDESSPAVRRIVPSTQLMRERLRSSAEHSEEIDELRELLRSPHIQALLFCHDKVSTCDLYVPDVHFHNAAQDPVDIILSGSVCRFNLEAPPTDTSLPLSRDVPSGRKEGAVIVFLERTNKPLGVTIYKQEESAFVGKLIRGCDAEASNVIREGDELLEVDGVPVWGKTIDNIVSLMSPGRTEEGDILVLTIIPLHDDNIDLEYETKYIRAHFNYNGRLDEEIPCKALGLAFQKGDILEIGNQDDPNWWQARKVFDDGAESLPGLVPSRHLQQQREALVRSYPFNFSSPKKKGFGSIFSKKRKKKVFYQSTSTSSSFGVGDEVPTYEEVVRLNPGQNSCRPVILIGPPGVGRRALIRELISSNPARFISVVPHTSRNPRPGEVDGRDYFFVTREEFESDMHRDRFLEYGEFKSVYYGTSFTSIKRIMESSKVPVLDVHPQALKKLRYSGLQPYVVFIASPRLERLQFTRKTVTERSRRSISSSSSQTSSDEPLSFTEHELRQMLEESLLIENQYGHYFDWVIVNDDFQVASDMLKEVVRRAEDEPQWVPALWKHDRY